MHAVIEAKGLSKLYRLGQRERYGALRDSLASVLAAPAKWLRGAKGSSDPAVIDAIMSDIEKFARAQGLPAPKKRTVRTYIR